MTQIRPVSDLRNRFAEISHAVHESGEPVILTKNGYGDMVVLSYDVYERMRHERFVASQLNAAEAEASATAQRFDHNRVMAGLRERMKQENAKENV